MESDVLDKGWITAEDVAKAKEIIATVSAEKAANLPQQMIENIAKGRLGKFFERGLLVEPRRHYGWQEDCKRDNEGDRS